MSVHVYVCVFECICVCVHMQMHQCVCTRPGQSWHQACPLLPEKPHHSGGVTDHLDGLAVKMSASRAEDLGFDYHLCHGHYSGSCHTSDLEIGIPVATLPGAWLYRVSTRTGWPSVSIL